MDTAPMPDDPRPGALRASRPSVCVPLDLFAEPVLVIDVETLEYVDGNAAAFEKIGKSRETVLAERYTAMKSTGYPREVLRAYYAELVRLAPAEVEGVSVFTMPDGSVAEISLKRRAFQMDGRWYVLLRATAWGSHDGGLQGAALVRHRTLARMSGSALAMVDATALRFLEISDAACDMLGRTREALMAMGPAAVLGMDAQALAAQYGRMMLSSPEITVQDVLFEPAPDRRVDAQVTSYASLTDGRWIVFSTFEDFTVRRNLEAELRRHVRELTRSNQELERFAYVASHDLSEPLRMVASYTQLLERRYGPKLDDEAREFIGYAVDGARRMKRLIDDLLAYSRAGRGDRPMRAVDMNAVLDAALKNLEQLVADKGAVVERARLPVVRGDETALVQLVQNLLANALKFAGERAPVVTVDAQRAPGDAGAWTLRVADNGIGIEPQYFERIFVVFQRLHTQDKIPGTGIGLAICRKIVEWHGGRLWVESEPGRGSSFFFTIAQGDTE